MADRGGRRGRPGRGGARPPPGRDGQGRGRDVRGRGGRGDQRGASAGGRGRQGSPGRGSEKSTPQRGRGREGPLPRGGGRQEQGRPGGGRGDDRGRGRARGGRGEFDSSNNQQQMGRGKKPVNLDGLNYGKGSNVVKKKEREERIKEGEEETPGLFTSRARRSESLRDVVDKLSSGARDRLDDLLAQGLFRYEDLADGKTIRMLMRLDPFQQVDAIESLWDAPPEAPIKYLRDSIAKRREAHQKQRKGERGQEETTVKPSSDPTNRFLERLVVDGVLDADELNDEACETFTQLPPDQAGYVSAHLREMGELSGDVNDIVLDQIYRVKQIFAAGAVGPPSSSEKQSKKRPRSPSHRDDGDTKRTEGSKKRAKSRSRSRSKSESPPPPPPEPHQYEEEENEPEEGEEGEEEEGDYDQRREEAKRRQERHGGGLMKHLRDIMEEQNSGDTSKEAEQCHPRASEAPEEVQESLSRLARLEQQLGDEAMEVLLGAEDKKAKQVLDKVCDRLENGSLGSSSPDSYVIDIIRPRHKRSRR